LKADVIKATNDDLSKLDLATRGQLPDENLGIGDATWALIAELEEELDTKPFYTAIRNFYVATIQKMVKKFPFGDSLLKDLEIINPESTCSYDFSTVRTLAKRFPQLGLADSPSMNKLREEFTDFCLSTSEQPEIKKYKGVDKVWRSRAGTFWWEVSKIKTLDGEDRFPLLGKLTAGLLSIPACRF